jgi:alanyl-tRNA synthetase
MGKGLHGWVVTHRGVAGFYNRESMTRRLYRADAWLRIFEADIIERGAHDGRPTVILDQTAFYPTSGGQPNDLGVLAGCTVLDVLETARSTGQIIHVLDRAPQVDRVSGEIDWARRFDHMQQHTGQHLLSAVFGDVLGLETMAVHIGSEECTLDLNTPALTADHIALAERHVRALIAENAPVLTYEVDDAAAARLRLRKPPKVSGLIRVVEIQGVDWSACGGTHVASTAQIGTIKIVRAERRGNETRVTFVCGERAWHEFDTLSRDMAGLSTVFSATRREVPEAAGRLREELRLAQRALSEAHIALAETEARLLLREADGQSVVARVYPGVDMNGLRTIARAVVAQPGRVVLLAAPGDKAALCFARSADVVTDVSALLKQALARVGGKGGGSRELAQGGGAAADDATLVGVLTELKESLDANA